MVKIPVCCYLPAYGLSFSMSVPRCRDVPLFLKSSLSGRCISPGYRILGCQFSFPDSLHTLKAMCCLPVGSYCLFLCMKEVLPTSSYFQDFLLVTFLRGLVLMSQDHFPILAVDWTSYTCGFNSYIEFRSDDIVRSPMRFSEGDPAVTDGFAETIGMPFLLQLGFKQHLLSSAASDVPFPLSVVSLLALVFS